MNLIQLSDLHLTPARGDKLFGVDPYENFDRVCREIQRIHAIKNIDLLVISGDITHDAGISVYQYFLFRMDKLCIPYIALLGNHDSKTYFAEALEKENPAYLIRVNEYESAHWYIAGVDTVITGKDEGFITQDSLDLLEARLQKYEKLNAAIFMHHHPIAVGTPLVDNCMLNNADALLSLCEKYPVKFIGCGHAHSPGIGCHKTLMVNVAPAVSFQWLPGTDKPEISSGYGFNQMTFSSNLLVKTCFY